MRHAIDTALTNTPIREAALSCEEFQQAIEKWGFLDDKGIHRWTDLEDQKSDNKFVINAQGGTVIMGNVETKGGKFVGRDDKSSDKDKDEPS